MNKRTSVKDELIKVMAGIEMTTYTRATACKDGNETVGEIAFKRFLYLLDAMKDDDFVGFQWTTGKDYMPDLHVFSSSTNVKPDVIRWAFPANEIHSVEKAEEEAVHFAMKRHIYFLESRKQDEEEFEFDMVECTIQKDELVRPSVNSTELLLALRAEQAILRVVAFRSSDRDPGILLLVSTPKVMSLRLTSVLTLFFPDTRLRPFCELKAKAPEEKVKTLIGSHHLCKTVSAILNKCMVLPRSEKEKEEEFANPPIEELELSVRTYNILKKNGISTVSELAALTESEIMKMRNMGWKNFVEIHEKLQELDEIGMLPEPEEMTKEPDTKNEMSDPMAALDALIGLPAVKEQARRIAAFARMQKDMKERNLASTPVVMNMEFTGNPGTAKTTVARILAGIFHQVGLLSSSELIEVGRADLVGEYTGHTAVKVKEVFQRAKGKVLFIDEAYSLLEHWENSYGDEAINTIVQEMENHRSETIVIFAGYPDKMAEFMSRNPGLRSRVPFHLSFSDYSAEEMENIAELVAKERGFSIAGPGRSKVESLCKEAVGSGEKGNGRFCRNLVENAIMNYATRVYGTAAEEPCEHDSSSAKALAPEVSSVPAGDAAKVYFELIAEDFTLPSMAEDADMNGSSLKCPIGFRM